MRYKPNLVMFTLLLPIKFFSAFALFETFDPYVYNLLPKLAGRVWSIRIAMMIEVNTITDPIMSRVRPSHLEPLCSMREAQVLISILSHNSLMNLGWTLNDLMVTRPDHVKAWVTLVSIIFNQPVRVSEKWEKTGALLKLSNLCNSLEEHLIRW